jgi:protein SCO1
MKNSQGRNVVILLAVVILPCLAWLLLTRGHNHFRHLPILGPAEISTAGDTIYHTVPPFSFVNQEGKTITDNDLKGKIYVANFFYATCPRECPKMSDQLKRVQDAFIKDDQVRIISHTINPEHDTVQVLADYAKKYGADPARWWFVTGNKEAINTIAQNGYIVSAAQGKNPEDFFHSQDLILVDKEKHIRGFYDGLDAPYVDTLIAEIKVLELEYREKERKK